MGSSPPSGGSSESLPRDSQAASAQAAIPDTYTTPAKAAWWVSEANTPTA